MNTPKILSQEQYNNLQEASVTPTPLRIAVPTTDLDRRAAALADVHQMHEDLRKALDMIGQLKADLAREQDRCALLQQGRRQLSAEMHYFRDRCVELATCVANIGLQTVTAQNIVMTVRERTEKAGEEALHDDQGRVE